MVGFFSHPWGQYLNVASTKGLDHPSKTLPLTSPLSSAGLCSMTQICRGYNVIVCDAHCKLLWALELCIWWVHCYIPSDYPSFSNLETVSKCLVELTHFEEKRDSALSKYMCYTSPFLTPRNYADSFSNCCNLLVSFIRNSILNTYLCIFFGAGMGQPCKACEILVPPSRVQVPVVTVLNLDHWIPGNYFFLRTSFFKSSFRFIAN